jgi:outer membrane phospholipase A
MVLALSAGLLLAGVLPAAELLLLPAPAAAPPAAGTSGSVRFAVYGLNREPAPLPARFPETLPCRISSNGTVQTAMARLVPATPAAAMVPPGAFVQREYEFTPLAPQAGSFQVELLPPVAPVASVASVAEMGPAPDDRLNQMALGIFRNFSPYDTNYFIVGTEDPVIRFQLSFKFGILGEHFGDAFTDWLGRPYVAYSQISLWDWTARSSPFRDTSYKPELFMLKQNVPLQLPLVRAWDFQYGVQHESNGKDADQSRSLNRIYLKPVFLFGDPEKFHLTLAPRFYTYIADMSDNRDMDQYRSLADLNLQMGWRDGLMLGALFRAGESFKHGTTQLELSYPMHQIPGFARISDNLFLFFQVFNGYGESLIDYDRHATSLRAGFAISR